MQRKHILIDTDPGVDDAMAIMMAHASADVLGLSIAAGNVGLEHTTRNALKLVEVIGAETPVFVGTPTPLVLQAVGAGFVHGADGFGDTGYAPSARVAEQEHAAHAIIRLSRAHAGELVIVAIAPLTNLALALKIDPDLPQRIARLVIMGGAVTGRGNTHLVPAEFNIGFDPEAAHVVFSAWPRFTLVDWELVLRHGIAFEALAQWLKVEDPRARFYDVISRKTRQWTRANGRPRVMLADAVAMAVALHPEIVTQMQTHHVGIELTGTLTRGATVVDWEDRFRLPANADIVMAIDQSRFESMVASALGASA